MDFRKCIQSYTLGTIPLEAFLRDSALLEVLPNGLAGLLQRRSILSNTC